MIARIKVAIDRLSILKAIDNLGTDIGTAADGRRVAENLSRLFYRYYDLPLARRAFLHHLVARSRKGAGTNERAGPGAKVFGAKCFTHDFTNVFVNVLARYVHELAIAVLVFENFA